MTRWRVTIHNPATLGAVEGEGRSMRLAYVRACQARPDVLGYAAGAIPSEHWLEGLWEDCFRRARALIAHKRSSAVDASESGLRGVTIRRLDA